MQKIKNLLFMARVIGLKNMAKVIFAKKKKVVQIGREYRVLNGCKKEDIEKYLNMYVDPSETLVTILAIPQRDTMGDGEIVTDTFYYPVTVRTK